MIKNLKVNKIFTTVLYRSQLYNKNLKSIENLSTIKKQKQKIENRLLNINLLKSYLKKRRNLIQFSYFSRFFLRKKQKSRFRFKINKDLTKEALLLLNLKDRFRKQEMNRKIKSSKKIVGNMIKVLSNRNFSIGILYLKYLRSNFFANLVWKGSSAKSSSGERYKGPKKKTMHAREAVLQKMAHVIDQTKLSTLDINIAPFGKIYKHLCRVFFRSIDVYVRYLITPRIRSHGFTRPIKIRRT